MKTKLFTNIIEEIQKSNLARDKKQSLFEDLIRIENLISSFSFSRVANIYSQTDQKTFFGVAGVPHPSITALKTLDELLERDRQRELDGFLRRIRIGKLMRPDEGGKPKVIGGPTTVEAKFDHDDRGSEEGPQTGGTGDEQEGEVIGETPAQPQEGEGEGFGAGKGGDTEHEILQDAFDLGKIITEKFELPNIKPKGKKPSFTKFQYDLTDIHRGFGQILDKKSTLRAAVKTNLLLGRVDETLEADPSDFLIVPQDHIYRILSKEKDFEAQAVVFFIRDYSGSMQGKPSEVIAQQHLFIYSWLMFQYQNNVTSRFILHDTVAKEVPDFFTYYRSQVAGGTRVAPAFQLVDQIIETERLHLENNIYVFYGTDRDDWDKDGREPIEACRRMLPFVNRIGITIARNAWAGQTKSTVENYFERSGLLAEKPDLIKLDSFDAESFDEQRIIKGIKILVG